MMFNDMPAANAIRIAIFAQTFFGAFKRNMIARERQ
jgi:hypothetical protein